LIPPTFCGDNKICFSFDFQTLLELYTENNALELASSPLLSEQGFIQFIGYKKTRLKEGFGTLFLQKKLT